MSFFLSSWERGMNENVVHAAPGGQVLTWAHALKVDELSHVGGSFYGVW
jgi:hypothetical protein